ncbi:ParB/RepB/Spo0J family partition protein [Marinovum sp.]|uniref:ParB/RepB/Spo0J family partition protein n=1 Tax=Marinovum sp. TaxID=2024839 RepID=UPI002B265AD2|nr:ParB/RepB/Spo0J family partition protein [Marinovum sp.]
MKQEKRRGLGRGLSALMADVEPAPGEGAELPRRADRMVPVERISPNPDQPRRQFTQDALQELANSIAEKGVIQPLIVRPQGEDRYEIVAGERRWRASQMAQLHEVPVIVREFTDTEVLEVAIIENIQRADLNPVEEAMGFRQLMDRFGHTQEKLAKALGKSRSHIANLLRLLTLPDEVRDMLQQGEISAGHARALVTCENAVDLAKRVVAQGLSVRETEKLARQGPAPEPKETTTSFLSEPTGKDADTRALEGDLSAHLGLRVSVEHKAGTEGGKLVLSYTSLEQLDDLCRRLAGE